MSILKLEREFAVEPEQVFAFVTRPENLLQWWGHEGTTIVEHQLDFSREGAWSSVMMSKSWFSAPIESSSWSSPWPRKTTCAGTTARCALR